MKMNRLISVFSLGVLALSFTACKNADKSFPDYDGGTSAYFAYQYPIRTLVLGNIETYDNTSDNEGRFTIYATCGGSYSGLNAKIEVKIDESLTDGLYFEDGTKVKPMPKDYYTVSGEELDYAGGYRGGIEIQLNDKFFADSLSITNNYVIPVVMGDKFSGVDQIVRGTPVFEGSTPSRHEIDKWKVTPGDFTLFCVNYINEYTATYLRRGVDTFDKTQFEGTIPTGYAKVTENRRNEFIERDEVVSTKTVARNKILLPIATTEVAGKNSPCQLILTFDDNGNCTIESNTAGCTAKGTGRYSKGTAIKAWGNKDRDELILDYTLDFAKDNVHYATKDTLVWRDRGTVAGIRSFKPVYKEE